jgi:hypothetical protein
MSSLVQEAILDAKKIREAAKKVALNSLKEKYSSEFKKNFKNQLKKISEADEMPKDEGEDSDLFSDLDFGGDEESGGGDKSPDPFADLSASAGAPSQPKPQDAAAKSVIDEVPTSFSSDTLKDQVVEIDLGEIVNATEKELESEVGTEDRKQLADVEPPVQTGLPGDSYKEDEESDEKDQEKEEGDEEEDLDSPMFDKESKDEEDDEEFSLTKESLEQYLDLESKLSEKIRHYEFKIKTQSKQMNRVEKENEVLKERLRLTNETLYKSNLENAKLVFKNKVLVDASLNDRQKKSMLESISKFNESEIETLPNLYSIIKEAVGAADIKSRKKESLTEILSSKSTAYIGGKQKEQEDKEEVSEGFKKWQKLAKLISD